MARGCWALSACVLAALLSCRGERVRFTEPCDVHSDPTIAAGVVGKVVAGTPYDVRRRDGPWIQVRVRSNRSIGWTRCPVQPP